MPPFQTEVSALKESLDDEYSTLAPYNQRGANFCEVRYACLQEVREAGLFSAVASVDPYDRLLRGIQSPDQVRFTRFQALPLEARAAP